MKRVRKTFWHGWLGAVLLVGGLAVAAPAEAAVLEAEAVWAAAETALAARLATEEKTVSYQWERFSALPPAIDVPDGEIALEANLPNGVRYGVPTAVRVQVRQGEARLYDWQLTFQVRRYARTVVAARDLPAGTLLTADDLRLAECDVTRVRGGRYDTVEAALGLETSRSLAVGSVISETLVKAPLLIRQGETVRRLARHGAVMVETTAEALTNGRSGALVRVKNLSTGKVLVARVQAQGVVEALAR